MRPEGTREGQALRRGKPLRHDDVVGQRLVAGSAMSARWTEARRFESRRPSYSKRFPPAASHSRYLGRHHGRHHRAQLLRVAAILRTALRWRWLGSAVVDRGVTSLAGPSRTFRIASVDIRALA